MLKAIRDIVFFVVVVMLLASCSVHEPAHAHVQDAIQRALNDGLRDNHVATPPMRKRPPPLSQGKLSNMLLPNVDVNLPNLKEDPADKRFDVNAVNLPANAFFTSLVKGTPISIVVDPDVKENISLVLKNVTILEAIQAASSAYGFQYEETAYGYHIEQRKLVTRIYTINYIDVDRSGTSSMRVMPSSLVDSVGGSSSGLGPTTTSTSGSASVSPTSSSEVKTTINNNFWTELRASLINMVGNKDGRMVVVNPVSGLVVVRAYPKELRSVSAYLYNLQNIVARQVILEAKVLEVNLNANYQAGIQWQLLGLNIDGTQQMNGSIEAPTNVFTLNINNNDNFKTVINLLNSQGRIEVLSSPRIATMDNQKAIIKVGEDKFFVTGVSNTTSGSLSNNVTQDVNFAPFFSGIALDVTPEITNNNSVTLHIHPVVSQVSADNVSFVLGSQATTNLPLATSSIRESDSVVHAKNGQVIVIGGLMSKVTRSFDASVPGIDQSPFRQSVGQHQREANKIELVILLKPIIVNPKKSTAWNNQIKMARGGFKTSRNSFTYTVHAGCQPEAQTVPPEPCNF